MPETDVIPTSASVASTGKGIRYIGDHAYAYSGAVVTGGGGSADGTVLEFTTGSGYISGQLMYQVDDLGGPTLYVEVKINDVVVLIYHGTLPALPCFSRFTNKFYFTTF